MLFALAVALALAFVVVLVIAIVITVARPFGLLLVPPTTFLFGSVVAARSRPRRH